MRCWDDVSLSSFLLLMMMILILRMDVIMADLTTSVNLPNDILEAIEKSDMTRVASLMTDSELINATSSSFGKCSGLAHSTKVGNTQIVQYFIAKGADVNSKCHEGLTPLMLACICSSQHEVVHNVCPFHLSILHKEKNPEKAYIAIMKNLIKNGADLHGKDNAGKTPIHYCALNGQKNLVETLIHAGADINEKDMYAWTPLMYAAQRNDVEAIRMLVEEGAWVNDHDTLGVTALSVAATLGFENTVKALLKMGADVHAKDVYNKIPLDYAEKNGHTKVVQLLSETLHEKDEL